MSLTLTRGLTRFYLVNSQLLESMTRLPRLTGASKKLHLGLDSLFDRLPAWAQNLSRIELLGFVGENLPNGADKTKP